MTTVLFPKRQRCLKCRKKLETPVLLGLYCSYRCAEKPNPTTDINSAPRGCKRQIDGKWDWKQKYRYKEEVPERLRKNPSTNIYFCENCYHLHVGHSRLPEGAEEKFRIVVQDFKKLRTIIKKQRVAKKYSEKDLAKILKVPIIRIKELEDPKHTNINPELLFAVMRVLKLRTEIIEL